MVVVYAIGAGHFLEWMPFEEVEIGARNGRKTGTEL
jgi:hypothetical protein